MLSVSLKQVVEQLETANDEMVSYINRANGELVMIDIESSSLAEDDCDGSLEHLPEWQRDVVAEAKRVRADKNFIALPGQYDINEYEIMERFCLSLDSEHMQNSLLAALKGRGAFARFKAFIYTENIHENWFAFKNTALKQIAIDFLDSENIPYQID